MENYLDRSNFLNRLRALQKLCSDHDSNFPAALLFVAGADGRSNKGSITVLKYLLRGSVSKDLFDETMETEFECLEELVILIKHSSVSVIWSHEMKALLSPLFDTVPFLIEYLSTQEEEDDIDKLQARKCTDFKRMMLESVKKGDGVGIPIPIGYDDIQDIESWPLLQSFALDHVYCPTGFFTANYNVADITAHLEILFRTVDGYFVDNAIRTMSRSVGPHMVQAISMLDASTAEQRMRVSADDVVGPLEILYDFGEMESAGTVDAGTKPIVLFGPDTAQLGAVAGAYPPAWRSQIAGRALHVVMEGCEPCTGIRWCRTYFLQRGRTAAAVDVSDDLLAAEGEDFDGADSKHSEPHTSAVESGVTDALRRLEGLYVKLLLGLRLVVRHAFAKHSDVLDAGTEVQTVLATMMKGGVAEMDGLDLFQQEQWRSLGLHDALYSLRPNEQLQVHMDCMNAVGEIVSIEDVDDMGGSCWTYIRVAVHGVAVGPYGAHPATVAVGDTFLFSSHRSMLCLNAPASLSTSAAHGGGAHPDRLLLQGDGCCITHPLPYYRCLIGAGAEERSSRRLLTCTKSTHLLPRLGLGKPLDYTGTGMLTTTVLSDHPVVPYFEAEIRTFTEGFLVEKMDGAMCLPMLVSIGHHVERVWTVDIADCIQHASRLLSPAFLQERALPDIEVPTGVLVIFRLKADDAESEALNPLQRSLPLVGCSSTAGTKHVALVMPSTSRSASSLTSACAQWRVAMRMHDVQEHRGGAEVAIPDGILRAFLAVLDFWREGVPNTVAATDTSGTAAADRTPLLTAQSYQALMATALAYAKHPTLSIPGAGYYAMRCVHSASDAQRVSSFDFSAMTASPVAGKTELIVLVGHAGSGIAQLAPHFAHQLSASRAVKLFAVDFATFPNGGELGGFVDTCIARGETVRAGAQATALVAVTVCPQHHVTLPTLQRLLESRLRSSAAVTISVLAPGSVTAPGKDSFRYAAQTVSHTEHGLGHEFWRASILRDLLQPVCCNAVVLVEDTNSANDTSREVRDFLAVANPTAAIIKMSPGSLRLDEETTELVQGLLQAATRGDALTEQQACSMAQGHPVAGAIDTLTAEATVEYVKSWSVYHPQCPSFVGCGVTTVHLSPATLGIAAWNLQSVLQTVHELFPTAKAFTSAVDSTWRVPEKQPGMPRFKRILQLAKAKVMCQRQEEEGRKVFNCTLERLRRTKSSSASGEEVLQRLVRGVRSIHGTLAVAGGLRNSADQGGSTRVSPGSAVLEGNAAFTILRVSPSTSAHQPVGLCVQGIFGKQEVSLLQELFQACAQYVLPPKAHLTADAVGVSDRLRIQSMPQYANQFALPGNWWFDGQAYVDINGTRRPLRPDIDKLVDLYVAAENAKIAEYNELLRVL